MSEKIAETTEHDDGGQAFPGAYYTSRTSTTPEYRPGMSLRDWLAGQALAGIASSITDMAAGETEEPGKLLLQAIEGGGNLAYAMADAALAARK